MVQLKVLGITYSQVQVGAYALILAETGGRRRIPVIIGTPEAQSIAIYLEKLSPPRPLTHDLFMEFVQTVGVELKQINIHKYVEGVFYSELIFDTGEVQFQMDARTSDAIALAVRTEAPIFMEDAIVDEVGILMTDEDLWDQDDEPVKQTAVSFESMNQEELQINLDDAIASEDYEKASLLRDIINKKSN